MKKFMQFILCGALALIGFSNFAHAQDLAFISGKSKSDASYLPAHLSNIPSAAAIPAEQVNARIIRQFAKLYKDAHNVRWYKENNGFLVYFDEAGMTSRASFGKHGYRNYDLRFGTEKDLPADVRKMIKSNYVDFIIGRVTEVAVGNQKATVVNLEDTDNLVLARITEEGLDEMAHFSTHAKTHKRARIVIPQ